MNPLKQLQACGQAPWLDFLKRSFIAKGELKALVDQDGLKGVTSNPSIFQKAIGESEEYTSAIEAFLKTGDHSISEIYEHLAIADIKAATDVLRPVYDQTAKRDGYVSLECSPYLANDTEATVLEALHLWEAVDRVNLMVKVPGTEAGTPAVRQLIAKGINVNITLLFSVTAYEAVVEAYLAGLEALLDAGGDLSKVASVASFFVSRIDAAVDKKLGALSDQPKAEALVGKVAIANAKLAYERYKELFSGPRWERLAAAGAQTQRLLWASTGTKNPTFKDTLYADALIGEDTVDTLPPATMDAFRDHGEAVAGAIEKDLPQAKAILADLASLGISLEEITEALVTDGVQQFEDAFDKLFASVAKHRTEILDGAKPRQVIEYGFQGLSSAVEAAAEDWRAHGKIRQLWAMDKALWTSQDEDRWGGWLRVVETELADVDTLEAFAKEVKNGDFTDVLLLGMGGSSLGPEVLGETFGPQSGWPRFHMLDSTDPVQIKATDQALDLAKTLVIVSSKSGSTLEPNIFLDYFLARAVSVLGKDEAVRHFVAVTDPGSSLDKQAQTLGFMHIFHGIPSIGGRYSVLSKFGLVPAAAIGLDVRRLLTSALGMAHACGPDAPPSENPGIQLGLTMGLAASRFGRDKVTIIAAPEIADLGAWLEQLLAESTGKQGKGLIPVAGEPLGTPDHYGEDRFFAYLTLEGAADQHGAAMAKLAEAGHPVVRIVLKDRFAVGEEFFRWEIATAVAGSVIGINPFDQPDVEASKIKTRVLTDAYETSKTLPKETPLFEADGVAIFADPRNAEGLGQHSSLSSYLKSYFSKLTPGDYVAFLAYVDRTKANTATLTRMRTHVRDKTHAATCVGFGPRFQHSTGQAYKGGPNTGVFIQITCADPADIQVPDHAYTFGVVKSAQASGDLGVLVDRGRRAIRIHLTSLEPGLATLAEALIASLP